jgi:hypothetical protein
MADTFFFGACNRVERVSLSGSYILRMDDITYLLEGVQTDPRDSFAPNFQLLPPGTTPLSTWTAGSWETSAPTGGPYAAFVEAGVGQAAPVNPGVAGRYRLWVQMVGSSVDPVYPLYVVLIDAP